jgi:uncharacterized membrane protein
MQILWLVLAAIGVLAVLAAIATVVYIVSHGYNPRDPQGSVGLMFRTYKRHIIAYFVLLAVGLAALSLAALIQRHAP